MCLVLLEIEFFFSPDWALSSISHSRYGVMMILPLQWVVVWW